MKHGETPQACNDLRQWLQALALLETLKAQTVAPSLDLNVEKPSLFCGHPGFFLVQTSGNMGKPRKLLEFGWLYEETKVV